MITASVAVAAGPWSCYECAQNILSVGLLYQ